MPEDPRSPRELYDGTAKGWVRTGPLSLSDFTGRPPTLALCEPVVGLRVLDLGCGEGYCARKLKASGARDVVAVDLSAAMIEAARAQERQEPLGIDYHVGDATNLSSHTPGEFDLVVAMFLFNYLGRDQTRESLQEIARVLRPGGKLVFTVPHPSLAFIRDALPPFYFEVGEAGYFSARDVRFPGRIWKRDGTSLEVQMIHKTVEDYFEALRSAGFTDLPIIRELGVTSEMRAIDPPFFAPLMDIPLHMAFCLIR
jgi:SAM-dependent methyltransferase